MENATQKTVESKVAGIFDFAPAPEAQRDSEAQVAADPSLREKADDGADSPEVVEDTAAGDEQREQAETKEAQEDEARGETPFEVDGRTFATRDELITAFREASKEGLRHANYEREFQGKERELKQRVMELEDKLAAQPFPGLLSPDQDQEAAQLELLPTHKQTEYILKKQEWEKVQAAAKDQRAQERKQLETSAAQVKESILNAEAEMARETARYPGFMALKPTRDRIVELTPSIANRPEAPYLSYWIAYGLNAFERDAAACKKADDAKNMAAQSARATQQQASANTSGKSIGATNGGTSSPYVAAWRDRNGAGL